MVEKTISYLSIYFLFQMFPAFIDKEIQLKKLNALFSLPCPKYFVLFTSEMKLRVWKNGWV